MTEPIRNKFDALDEGMAARHGQTLDKLDDIIEALAPGADYTAAFASLGEKLDAIATKQDTTNVLLTSVYGVLPDWALTTTAIANGLAITNSRLATIDDNIQQIQSTIGLHSGGAEFTLASLVRAQAQTLTSLYTLLSALGAPWPADVLAALECICDAAREALPKGPLDPRNNPPCDDPYTSDGLWLGPFGSLWTGTDVIVAVFNQTPPEGIIYGATFGITVDKSELISGDWSQWHVYVESDAAQYQDSPTSLDRYPTNQWRQLSGSGGYAFSVDARFALKVYLCKVTGECITSTEYITLGGYRRFIFNIPGVEVDANGYHLFDAYNWTFDANGEAFDDPAFFVQVYSGPDYTEGQAIDDPDASWGTIGVHTVSVAFLGSDSTTSVTICPPGVNPS